MMTRRKSKLAATAATTEGVITMNVNKRCKHATINFSSKKSDPILEHLRDSCKTKTVEEQQNVDTEILDQIALEGLSGITLGQLFRYLEAIFPSLKCISDESCQNYVWSVIVNRYLHYPPGANVQAFYLNPSRTLEEQQQAKPPLNKGVVIDKQISLPLSTVQRVAKINLSLYPVQDGPIMGSCANYLNRTDITIDLIESLRKNGTLASMYDVNIRYGLDNVFFVAGQTLRSKAILPNWVDPNADIKLREYCTLEWIGKSRTLGTVFPNDKTLGRYRIMLLAKGLITQYQETNSSPIEHHLKRFILDRPTSSVMIAKQAKIESSDEEDNSEEPLTSLCCNPSELKVNRSTLTMVYDTIAESDGVTQIDIRKALHMPKFHLRNHLKNLISIKMVCGRSTKDTEHPSRIYRTVYRNVRKKKKKNSDEFESATGIMANWDEADLRAKKIIGHKRSTFSQAEDSLLILCRITSLLIEPRLRLSWCVHKRVVRDIMHKKLVESHDKTSDACLRRIKYLKRLPNNIMSINELTAELQDDPDIIDLIQRNKHSETDDRLNKLFIKVLKTVRSKIPSLLGITGHMQTKGLRNFETGGKLSVTYAQVDDNKSNNSNNVKESSQSIVITNHKEMYDKFELIDCQSVASIKRAPTYERPKNVVDIKLNTASLVTMAYTLSSFLHQEILNRRACQWLLEKFYSSQHDKLINSVLSRLTKRSLLTRKCPTDRALSVYKPKTKTSLKLNQSVHFLLNRYHSTSLMQLTRPISQLYAIELNESNEMGSFAMLTSLCSISSFNFDLKLKIPTNVVSIDQGNENFKSLCEKMRKCAGGSGIDSSAMLASDKIQEGSRRALFLLRHELKCGGLSDCLIVQPCNVKFYSAKSVELTKSALDSFLDQAKPIDMMMDSEQQQQQQRQQANWLVKSFRLPSDNDPITDGDFEAQKIAVEFEARLWKNIDGSVHLPTLLKLIEALLSWIIVLPGVELTQLQREFGHLMPDEHLLELLQLMGDLELISSLQLAARNERPRLFGYAQVPQKESTSYEPTAGAFVQYCQLLSYCDC